MGGKVAIGPEIDPKLADDCFASNGSLAKQHLGARTGRKIYIYPASEPDQANPLPRLDPVPLLDEGHDPACHQAGDLREADRDAVVPLDDEMLPLVVFTSLIKIGIEKFAR